MSIFRRLICCIALCSINFLLCPNIYSQDIPQQMSYQGVIRQGDKVPADGNYVMTFSLYTTVSGSQAIWTETQQVSVNGGLFNVILGSFVSLPSALPPNVWVGVRFGGDEEFSRTKLTSVPFALTAGTAQALAPNAKGAVLSLNGHQGAVELKGSDGLKVSSDNGILTIGMTNERKSEDVLNQGTEWLLAGNSNATSTSWLGTTNNFPLIIKTNNTERMRVLSSGNGNVGIGDNNPGSRLTVAKTFHLTNAGGAPELKLSAASGANSTTFKTTSQSSNITYTLPANDGNDGEVLMTDGTGELTWTDNGWGTSGNSNISSTKFLGTTNSQPLIIKTNNSERFRVTSGGAMGINEDNPSQKLEVAGNILIKPDGSNTGELRIQEASGGSGNNYTAFRSGMMGTNITYTLPTVAPAADQVLTSSALGVLSWTTPSSGATGTAGGDLTGTYPNPEIAPGVIVNADISGTAAIAYGKLDLTGSIVNADISNSAAIAYSKLDLTGNIIDADISGTAAIAYSKLDLTGSIVNSDVSATAAIAYSKLDLAGSIVDADISGTAAIAYSKLDLAGNIVDADISGTAAIAYSKLDLTGNITNSDVSATAAIAYSKLDLAGGIVNADVNASAAIAYSKLNLTGGIVNSDVSNSAAISYSKLDLAGSIVDADISGTAAIAYSKLDLAGNIVDADISGTAAIAYSKLDLTGNITNSDVSATAAIAYSKLDLAGGIVNSDVSNSAAIAYSKLDLAGSIVDADISGTAAIAYSKLDLTGNIVNADISGTAAIAYSKLDLAGNITNSDVSATAAIAYSKLDLANSIVAGDITTGAVTTAKIADNAVDGTKIAMGSDATGDLMYYDGTDYVRLPIGSSTNVLTVSGGVPVWASGGLTSVTRNATLTGSGTSGSPLGINLANSNTWTANQTFAGTFLITSNSRIALTNSDNNGRDIRWQEPSGTGSQYIGLRAPNVTNNGNYVFPAVVGSVGQVLTLQTSNNIDSATMSWTTITAAGTAGGDLTGSYPNPTIAASAVTTAKINNNAVDGTKIAMGSDATGDIMYYDGTDYVRLPIGADTEVLTVSSGVPTWAAGGGGGGGSPTGAAGGDLSGTYPNPDIAAGVIVNADINASAGIAYSKLNLTNSIVSGDIAAGTIDNSDISGTAAIAYSKLNLTNSIVAGDITSSAVTTSKIANNAVDGTKIAMGSDATGDIMYYNGTDYTRRAIGSNGDVLTVSGGVPTWAAPSGGGASVRVRAYRNAQQTINTNTTLVYETVVFNTEDYDTGGEYNTSSGVFTAATSGYYLISSTTTWGNNAAGVRAIRITKNGSGAARGSGNLSNTLAVTSTTVSTILQLTAGDTIEIEVAGYSGSASTTTVEAGTDQSYLQITKIQ